MIAKFEKPTNPKEESPAIPTIGERADRADRAIVVACLLLRPFHEDGAMQVDTDAAQAVYGLLKDARMDAFWLTRLADDVRDIPAPDDDQVDRDAAATDEAGEDGAQ